MKIEREDSIIVRLFVYFINWWSLKKIVRELGANEKEKGEIIFKEGHFDLILFRCYFTKPFNVMNREILIPLPIEFSLKFSLRHFLKRLSWNFEMMKECDTRESRTIKRTKGWCKNIGTDRKKLRREEAIKDKRCTNVKEE